MKKLGMIMPARKRLRLYIRWRKLSPLREKLLSVFSAFIIYSATKSVRLAQSKKKKHQSICARPLRAKCELEVMADAKKGMRSSG